MSSEREVVDAVVAALVALGVPALELGAASTGTTATDQADQVQVTVSRRYGGTRRVGGPVPDAIPWRITTRPVSKSINNARESRRRVALWEGTQLTVGGVESSPIEFETEEPIGPDDGFWSGLTTWTFSL